MKKLILFPLILCMVTVNANDGSFYSSGSTITPLKETTLKMKAPFRVVFFAQQFFPTETRIKTSVLPWEI